MLLERPGQVVTREEIQKRLWPDHTIVEFDHSINAAIKRLREALGDSAHNPRFVETLARRGYRFLVPVDRQPDDLERAASELPVGPRPLRREMEPGPSVGQLSASTTTWTRFDFWRKRRLLAVAGVLAFVLATGGALLLRFASSGTPSVTRTTPLTGNPGWEEHPAFSPDGSQVAFSWAKKVGGSSDIYVKLIGAGVPLRLTTMPGINFCPAWSPDGRYIAFLRRVPGGSGIFVIPALGGPESKLGQSAGAEYDWGSMLNPRLSWSPNRKYLAIVDKGSPQDRDSIFLLSAETGEKRRLTSPPAQFSGDGLPAFSPDGQQLAFARCKGEANDLYVLSVTTDGTPRGECNRLTFDQRQIASLDWTPDGRGIVFSSNRADTFSIRKVSAAGGEPTPLVTGKDNAFHLSVSRRGHRLAYSRIEIIASIWRTEGPSWKGRRGSHTRLIASNGIDMEPQFSPDRKRIVFTSTRSGSSEIWRSDSNGSNPVQLTSLGGTWLTSGSPRWSPDGRYIAFDSYKEGHHKIHVVSVGAGFVRQLTTEPDEDRLPSWSYDGHWVYFGSDRSGTWQVWKVPADGGPPTQLSRQGGDEPFESSDGKFIYYYKAHGIWKVPVGGGDETQVLDHTMRGHWALLPQGICLFNPIASPGPALEFFSFATHQLEKFATLPGDITGSFEEPALTASPDGRWVLYDRADHVESGIQFVENFR